MYRAGSRTLYSQVYGLVMLQPDLTRFMCQVLFLLPTHVFCTPSTCSAHFRLAFCDCLDPQFKTEKTDGGFVYRQILINTTLQIGKR